MLKQVLVLIGLFTLVLLTTGICQAQESRKLSRSTSALFRATPNEQVRFQEQTLIEQALQDKFDTEFNYQDQYDPEYRWAANLKERGLLDNEDVRSIAKNRAANRTRKTIEHAIKGSDLERGYKKLVKNLRKFRDYTTVKIEENDKGKIRAKHKRKNQAPTKPMLEFYLQPDLSSGLTAIADTRNNIRFRYQPTRNRLTVGYSKSF